MLVKKAPHSSLPYQLLLFLISPLLAFVNSVKHIHKREHFWIVLSFALFFCYTYIPIPYSDATRYEERFSSIQEYNFSTYVNDVINMYGDKSFYQDAYIYTIQFFVSPFTTDGRIYRSILGFIYFYTFLSLIKHLLLNNGRKTKKFNWFIIGIVFLISFTAGINGIRWPLALMVFLLGSYRYITTSKFKFVLLAILSPLIHFICFYLVVFLLIYVLTKRFYNPKIISIIVLIFFFISSILASTVQSNIGLVGEKVQEKSSAYIESDSWKEKRVEGYNKLNWYVQIQRTAPNIFVMLALFITTYFGYKLEKSTTTIALEYFAFIFFMASSLSAQLLVATDNRFTLVSTAVGLFYLYHLYNENSDNKLLNLLNNSYIPIAVLTLLVNIWTDLQTISPNLILGNLITEMIFTYNDGIRSLIGF